MLRSHRDGLTFLMLGVVVLAVFGPLLGHMAGWGFADFAGYYYPAKCLLEGGDPYRPSDVHATMGRTVPGDLADNKAAIMAALCIHPPSEFSITAAISLLPYRLARASWIVASIASVTVGAFLIWKWGANDSPVLCGACVGLMLVNSMTLIAGGNIAGIVIGLSIVATWCIFKRRNSAFAALALALSFMLKPQDVGFLWLYFLWKGGTSRKRALEALALMFLLSAPCLLWLSWHSPHWLMELSGNVKSSTGPGGFNDPHTSHSVVNLQAALSLFSNDPRIYNAASYALCGALLLAAAYKVVRSNLCRPADELVLAAIVPLSLLITYHRTTDAPLLLYSVPALTILWARCSRKTRRAALLATLPAMLFTGDLFRISLFVLANHFRSKEYLLDQLFRLMQVALAPSALLAMSVFYLVMYWRTPLELDREDTP